MFCTATCTVSYKEGQSKLHCNVYATKRIAIILYILGKSKSEQEAFVHTKRRDGLIAVSYTTLRTLWFGLFGEDFVPPGSSQNLGGGEGTRHCCHRALPRDCSIQVSMYNYCTYHPHLKRWKRRFSNACLNHHHRLS